MSNSTILIILSSGMKGITQLFLKILNTDKALKLFYYLRMSYMPIKSFDKIYSMCVSNSFPPQPTLPYLSLPTSCDLIFF